MQFVHRVSLLDVSQTLKIKSLQCLRMFAHGHRWQWPGVGLWSKKGGNNGWTNISWGFQLMCVGLQTGLLFASFSVKPCQISHTWVCEICSPHMTRPGGTGEPQSQVSGRQTVSIKGHFIRTEHDVLLTPLWGQAPRSVKTQWDGGLCTASKGNGTWMLCFGFTHPCNIFGSSVQSSFCSTLCIHHFVLW